jgi:hypothetical protein
MHTHVRMHARMHCLFSFWFAVVERRGCSRVHGFLHWLNLYVFAVFLCVARSWSEADLKKVSARTFELDAGRQLKQRLIKWIFEKLDGDKSGFIDVDEVGAWMKQCKLFFLHSDVAANLDCLEKDGKIYLRELSMVFHGYSVPELCELASQFHGFEGARVSSFLRKKVEVVFFFFSLPFSSFFSSDFCFSSALVPIDRMSPPCILC